MLVGPGWSSPGATDDSATSEELFGGVGVGTLRHAGYNVLTWDPRGFGRSGGQVEVDSPDYEARDASALIDWLARQPEAQLDKRATDLGHGVPIGGFLSSTATAEVQVGDSAAHAEPKPDRGPGQPL